LRFFEHFFGSELVEARANPPGVWPPDLAYEYEYTPAFAKRQRLLSPEQYEIAEGAYLSWRESGDAVVEGHHPGRVGGQCTAPRGRWLSRVNDCGSRERKKGARLSGRPGRANKRRAVVVLTLTLSTCSPPRWPRTACLSAQLARLRLSTSHEAGTQHLQQCAEFPPLRDCGLSPFAMTILPVPLSGRAAAYRLAVQAASPLFFVAGDRQGLPLLVRAPH
jgi:hypothetical protein